MQLSRTKTSDIYKITKLHFTPIHLHQTNDTINRTQQNKQTNSQKQKLQRNKQMPLQNQEKTHRL